MAKTPGVHVINVATNTETTRLAGAVTELLREHGTVELHAIGPMAVNQAAKAIAASRGHLAATGYDAITMPAFFVVTIHGEEKTGLKFITKLVNPHQPSSSS